MMTISRTMLVLAIWCVRAAAASDPVPVITIHADAPSHRVPETLWGVFFEEINHAGDGGLSAELVRNRAFEEPLDDAGGIPGWSIRPSPGSNAAISLDSAAPENPTAPNAMRVWLDGGSTSVMNEGFWGIPIAHGAKYLLRLDARATEGMRRDITITLESPEGTALARTTLGPLSESWRRFEATIEAGGATADARLVLNFEGKGGAWVDTVSLMPAETWKSRRFGLRRDLGALVENLHPAFVRFPGGCYVEGGDLLKDRFDWPTTLGDISRRPGHSNATWRTWSTDALGLHEYLQWCEDLGAAGLFVVNCGISHQEVVPMDRLGPWVEDALNAIEYAVGPADSTWGARRASNGHPSPFPLKFVEIGNENGQGWASGGSRAQYAERYRAFRDAIAARFPQITLIADTRIEAPIEVVDDHYYNSPAWFWANTGLYDRAERAGPKVYVGEYAVTQGCGHGNLAAALGEAAFMTGLERNSDIVVMASYAPMFVHVNDRAWNPDMMVFDGTRSFGTPSYWVQRLFAENRPNRVLPLDLPAIEQTPEALGGAVGLGTWNTAAEFKDVSVEINGRTVYASDFSRDNERWKAIAGDWSRTDGVYRQAAIAENRLALLDLAELRGATDYTLRVKARKLRGEEGFLIVARAADATHHTWWNIGGWSNTQHAVERDDDTGRSRVGQPTRGSVETGRWYDIRVELKGASLKCYLDGTLVHEAVERPRPALAGTAGLIDATGEIILKIVNGGNTPITARVRIPGSNPGAWNSDSAVLTSDSLTDENSFEAPARIAPVRTSREIVASEFDAEFPARSLTILRAKPATKNAR